MVESSGGYRESSSSSRDLMARYDMAHDRADRSPEVRAYLESLRPQILKLQRELRLQTQEDIDGLGRRDDLRMNDVDKLVDLIQAFRIAWTENRLSRSEARRLMEREAAETAGVAFEGFADQVSELVDRSNGDNRRAIAVIRAIALAGEPRLAWTLFSKLPEQSMFAPHPDGHDLVTSRMAIWDAFVRRGETPPFGPDEILVILTNLSLWNRAVSDGVAGREAVALELIPMLLREGRQDDAVRVALTVQSETDRIDLLLSLRSKVPNNPRILAALVNIERRLSTSPKYIQVHYWNQLGNVDRAEQVFRSDYSGDAHLLDEYTVGQAANGRADEALQTIRFLPQPGRHADMIGRVAVACLKNGDVPSAIQAIGSGSIWDSIGPREIATIVRGLLDAGNAELAMRLARTLAFPREPSAWEQASAMTRTLCLFAERRIDTEPLIAISQAAIDASVGKFLNPIFRDSVDEAKTATALRTFKRVARTTPLTPNPDGTWNRAAWESLLSDSLARRRDLGRALTYDLPIDRDEVVS